jgi:septum formation protein
MANGVSNVELILASQSPRRKYLLEQAGLRFRVIPSPFDESSVASAEPAAYVRRLAEGKADDVAARYPEACVIGADTIVAAEDRLLGKPSSQTTPPAACWIVCPVKPIKSTLVFVSAAIGTN